MAPRRALARASASLRRSACVGKKSAESPRSPVSSSRGSAGWVLRPRVAHSVGPCMPSQRKRPNRRACVATYETRDRAALRHGLCVAAITTRAVQFPLTGSLIARKRGARWNRSTGVLFAPRLLGLRALGPTISQGYFASRSAARRRPVRGRDRPFSLQPRCSAAAPLRLGASRPRAILVSASTARTGAHACAWRASPRGVDRGSRLARRSASVACEHPEGRPFFAAAGAAVATSHTWCSGTPRCCVVPGRRPRPALVLEGSACEALACTRDGRGSRRDVRPHRVAGRGLAAAVDRLRSARPGREPLA